MSPNQLDSFSNFFRPIERKSEQEIEDMLEDEWMEDWERENENKILAREARRDLQREGL